MLHFDYLGCLNYKKKIYPYAWTLEWGQGALAPPGILKILAKMIVFLVSSGKIEITMWDLSLNGYHTWMLENKEKKHTMTT